MTEEEALKLSQEIQISPEQVLREEYEMLILNQLSNSQFGKNLIFKGGTALRLAYKSPRFSEDLDFSLTKAISFADFKKLIENLCNNYPQMKLKEIRKKRFTIFALVSIKEDFLAQPFSIKIEISRRPVKWKKNRDYFLKSLESITSPLEITFFVVTLDLFYKDKSLLVKQRSKARDLFDLWYTSQKLGKPFPKIKYSLEKRQVKSELRKYLPKNRWLIIEELL